MHPEKACAKCKFAVAYTVKGQINPVLLCKRFPPKQNYMGPHPQTKQPWININHIQVQPLEWCHEFAPAEGEIFRESENAIAVVKN